jgi:hypothetical protein
MRDAKLCLCQLAANNAPDTEPTALREERGPNARASEWKTPTAIVAMKMGKFRPKVPSRNNIIRIALRSGLRRT